MGLGKMNELSSFKSYKKELDAVKDIEGLLVPGQEKTLMVIASKLKEGSTVVEIGSFKGKSTACIALGSPPSTKIYAIDTFEGNKKDFLEGVQFVGGSFFEEFKQYLTKVNVWEKIRPKIGLSKTIGKKWDKKIDFLFIDGSHLYEDVKADFQTFFPWVKEGGIVAFHDVSSGFPGVLKFWNETAKSKLSASTNVYTLYFGIKRENKRHSESDRVFLERIREESTTKKTFIILPVHNRIEFTKKCLKAVYSQNYKNIETIVVDDGSTDGTSPFIRKTYPQIKIIKGAGNWWWTKSINIGIQEALKTADEEDFILTMNNDCFFGRNYIGEIVDASQKNFRSIVGSYILDASDKKRVIDAGVIINWKQSHIYGLSDRVEETASFLKDNDTIVGIDTLPGKGTLIPVEVFVKIGLLNNILLPHYASDFEFFCRAKRKGVNLIVSKKARIYNFAKATGTEHGNFHHTASYKDVFKVLFSRKSKVNILDHFFFLILACPKKYLLVNLKNWMLKLLNYLLLLYPFYYLKFFLSLSKKLAYHIKLTIHRTKIFIRQTHL